MMLRFCLSVAISSSILSIVCGFVVNHHNNNHGFLTTTTTTTTTTSKLMMSGAIIAGESCTGERIAVVGATGYIGKAVVRESVRRGYPTTAVMRDASKGTGKFFEGSNVQEFDVGTDFTSNTKKLFDNSNGNIDVVVCCLASRSGTKQDSYNIDYQAALNCAKAAKEAGARRFILLSAYCVLSAERKDPYALQFQYAKLKLETELKEEVCIAADDNDNNFDFISVRPTAFFKSVSGQLEVVNSGAPFVYFDLDGKGKCATCNPISEPDLAAALVDQIADDTHKNGIWNIGGPDDGYSMREQGEMIHDILQKEGAPKLLGVPISIFGYIINALQWAADTFQSTALDDAAELGRIGQYYAVEDMLTTTPTEKYGKTTLRQHYEYIAENGQEYDPYTSVFGSEQKTTVYQQDKK